VLRAVSGPHGERVRELLESGRPYGDETVAEVISLVRDGGHVDAALETAATRLTIAESALATLPKSKPKEILEGLGAFLLARVEAARG
jgi:geranylgeranyl pyrophosphate synthase